MKYYFTSFRDSDNIGHVLYLDAFNSGGLIRPETYIGNGGGSGCPYRDLNCPKGPAKPMEVVHNLSPIFVILPYVDHSIFYRPPFKATSNDLKVILFRSLNV